jgi:type IV pilus assembly protein PilC
MPNYNYTARDQKGVQFKGKVEAPNQKDAATLIRDKGMYLTHLSEVASSSSLFAFSFMRRVSFKDVVGFTRQLSTMTSAGLQIPEALALLKAQSPSAGLADVLNKIYRDIQGGSNLSSALVKYPTVFSTTYIALVRAGESSGTLDKVLLRLADNIEKDLEFRSKIKGALTYPAIILTAMVAVFAILMIVVVPKLTEIYVSFGQDLPLPTRILQGMSDFSVRFWWLILILIVGGSRLFKKWKKTDIGKHMWDGFTLRLPLMGTLQKQMILVEFTRTLGLLVGAGVHILDALHILIESVGNVHYEEALEEITKKVEKGLPLGQLFGQYPIFPPILAQMVKVGEETGKMDESLIKLSVYFESESDNMVKGLTTAIEPLIMIILGVGVGFIVFAIITPIYNLTSNIK